MVKNNRENLYLHEVLVDGNKQFIHIRMAQAKLKLLCDQLFPIVL